MAKTIWKGGALLAPLPAVLITCRGMDKNGIEAENVFTVAWTGILNTVPPKTYISVRKSRFSYDIIKNSGEFVINVPTSNIVREVDYCGIYTGAKVDKFEKCNFTLEAASNVTAPCIAECPLCLECKVTDVVEMGTHDMFVADILCTDVNEDIIDADGKLRLDKAKLMAFAHGEYFALGKKIGNFGFSAKKRSKGKDTKKAREGKETNTEKGFADESKSLKKSFSKKGNDSFSFDAKIGDEAITDMRELLEFVESDISRDDAISEDMFFEASDKQRDYVKKYKSSFDKRDRSKEAYAGKDRKKYDDKGYVKKHDGDKRYGKDEFGGKDKNHGKRNFGPDKKEYGGFDKNRHGRSGEKKNYGKDRDVVKKEYKSKFKDKNQHGKKEKQS